jgi:PhnB protein
MEFYKTCLGGELKVMTVGESPMAAKMPKNQHKLVLHANLEAGPVNLMASDMLGPERAKKGNMVSLSLSCSNQQEIETLFAKLSEGGKIGHPLSDEFFGTIGDVTDRFGTSWMLVLEPAKS